MNSKSKLIELLEQYVPNVTEYLSVTQNTQKLKEMEEYAGVKLPSEFINLYTKYDGEKEDSYLGAVLGLTLLSAEQILENMKIIHENDFSEMQSANPDVISDEKMCERIVIPFAFDHSRCYIAIDMTPGPKGKIGQIITLDFDYDSSYLIADSMEGLYAFMEHMFEEKKCVVEEQEHIHFEFETGHFFNCLDDLLIKTTDKDSVIVLPDDFWKQKYGKDSIEVPALQKEKMLWITKKDKNVPGLITVSFKPIEYMTNLRELIIHDTKIEDFEAIMGAQNLQELFLIGCDFTPDKLEILAKLPRLKNLHIGKMDKITSIKCLEQSDSIKELGLIKMTSLKEEGLCYNKKIQTLELENLGIDDYSFLTKYKNLKEVEIEEEKVKDLNFLHEMKKLVSFKMENKAMQEEGLVALKDIKKLKSFKYPVTDSSVYEGCHELEEIGIDAKGTFQFEVFKDSKLRSVMVYHADGEEEVENIVDEIKKYVKITCYGYTTKK